MDDVLNILRRAARRLFLDRLIRALPVAAAIALACLAGARLLERLAGVPMDWSVNWIGAGVGAALASIVWAAIAARDRAAVARLIDERAELRESLSTALTLGDQNDAWSVATIEDARRRAKGVDLRRAVPWSFPQRWPLPALAALAFMVVWFAVPQADLFGRDREREAEAAERQEIVQAESEAEAIDDELRTMLAKLGDEDFGSHDEALDTPKPSTPDEIRRAAIRKLTSVQDRLDQLKSNQDSGVLDAIKDQMRRLRQPGLGPANEVVSALQRGDFARASEKLGELMSKIAGGELSDEQKKRLQEQLADLAEQLEKLAREHQELERQLRQAGIDPAVMNDPNALQEAIQNAQGLSDEQQRQLMEQAQRMQGASENAGRMAQALNQAARQMGQGGNGMQGMGEMADMLNELEMMAQEMQQIGAAQQFVWGKINDLSQCLGGGEREISPFQLWDERSGGRGPGGAQMSASDAQANTTKVKAPSKMTEGPIIGSTMVEGEQVRGESRAQFVDLVEAGGQAAADAIENKAAPREYHDALKHYFGRLKAKAEAEAAPDAPSAEPEPE